jgi:hypothetical protein
VTASPYSRAPVAVELCGVRIVVPYRSAAEWVAVLGSAQDPATLLLNLAREATRESVLNELVTGEITAKQLTDASYELMRAAVPGFHWWETYRLLDVSATHNVVGRATLAGLDPWVLTAAQWCSAIYVMLRENTDDSGRLKFDHALSTPPLGVEDDGWGDMSMNEMVNAARNMPGMG